MSEMTLANEGVAHDVPSTVPSSVSHAISKLTPWNETSGKPRPEALYKPLMKS